MTQLPKVLHLEDKKEEKVSTDIYKQAKQLSMLKIALF